MRTSILLLLCICTIFSARAQSSPSDSKAKATFAEAQQLRDARRYVFALDAFRKANRQDGGRCQPCLMQAVDVAFLIQDYKAAGQAAQTLLEMAATTSEKAAGHSRLGLVSLRKGIASHKDKDFLDAEREYKSALELVPDDPGSLYDEGTTLAYLRQDDAAKERFLHFLKSVPPDSVEYQRVSRLALRPELARARMAPPFRVTAMDGRTVSLDSLAGKVVLIDFWATWCGPCREALPQIQKIAQKFKDEPLVVLSISLDSDSDKWEAFVHKNGMTWLQYRDGSFTGPVSKLFDVKAIPHTFTIDADGVLQDEHIGDASIEGKLKKLTARAREARAKVPAVAHGE